jgi:hypothetical protein
VAHSRIDDLRRRVEADPASIAFAQLAEEYRRAGQTEEAVRVSREGLTRHPGYLSARVTLGRALLDLGELADARVELQFVASEAPENLAAVRGLAEIFHREGDAAAALEYFQRALSLARHDPELEEIVQQLSRQVGAESGPSSGLTFEEAHQELLSAANRVPLATSAEPTSQAGDDAQGSTAPFDFDTLVAALGSPAAPPLVEAVVRGEAPQVFELPELPAVAGDPFAMLEAELRAQPTGEPDSITTEPYASVPPAPADEALDEGWLTPRLPEAASEAEPAGPAGSSAATIESTREPSELTQPLDPWLSSITEFNGVEKADAVADAGGGPFPEASTDVVADALETATEAVTHTAESDEESAIESTSNETDVSPVDPPAPAERSEASSGADPASVASEAQPSAAPAAAPAPSSPRRDGDDVLGDIEDWLHTLQDRSNG